jgi:hypothetical protein
VNAQERIEHLKAERDRARDLAAALEAQVARVETLAEEWRYKGEFGWGAWQEGHGPGPEGHILDCVAGELRQAIA